MSGLKASVIVPCYNVERFLAKCLDSIINQTLRDIEIICVNDCSSDKTPEILEAFSKKDERIKIINHEKNRGLSAARNSGMSKALGDYIAFVDSDDYIDKTMLEKLYNKAEKTESELVIGNVNLYFEDTGTCKVFRDTRFFTFLSGRVFTLTEYPALVSCIAAWDRLYKRELIERGGLLFPEGVVYEDQPFSIKAMLLAKKITVVNEPLYYYRKNAGGSITDNEKKNDKYKFDFLKITELTKDFMKSVGAYGILRKEYMKYQFLAAAVHQSNIRDKKSFKLFFKRMLEITSQKDLEALAAAKLDYLSERYLSALNERRYSDFYKLTRTISFGKSFLNIFIPRKKRG